MGNGNGVCALAVAVTVVLAGACGPAPEGVREVSAAELLGPQAGAGEGPLVLDVRSEKEFAAGHVRGAVNIPHDRLGDRLAEVEAYRDQEIVVYCESGRRAGIAAEILSEAGFKRLGHLSGDMSGWRADGHPVASP